MKHSLMKYVLLATIATLFSGCAGPVGRKFDTSYTEKITPGVTTKAMVRESLGKPMSVNLSHQGEVWFYQYMPGGTILDSFSSQMFGADSNYEIDMLQIIFEGDTVKDYSLSKRE